jgi:ribonuclease HIII
MQKNSFTFPLDKTQQVELKSLLATGNYRPADVPYTQIAVQAEDCRVALYTSGKCVVQGKGAEAFVRFTLEPLILKEARLDYQAVHDPEALQPHIGIDESGKGDFFGPMVIAAAYVDADLAKAFDELGVRDSKRITSDKKAEAMATEIRKLLRGRFALITIGPRKYNQLYTSMRSVNNMLAWAHARALEDLLEKVPDCRRAVADQFGPKQQIEKALMKRGRDIELVQRPKAESDPAVAAASILARAGFIAALRKLGEPHGLTLPKGASAQVRQLAVELVADKGPDILLDLVKGHFRTTDQVLEANGLQRSVLGPDGAAVSKAFTGRPKARSARQ